MVRRGEIVDAIWSDGRVYPGIVIGKNLGLEGRTISYKIQIFGIDHNGFWSMKEGDGSKKFTFTRQTGEEL